MTHPFVVLCSRLDLRPDILVQVESRISAGLNWDEVVKKAREDGVAALLFRHLKKYRGRIPDSALDLFKNFYYQNLARNLVFFQKLKPLFNEIEDSGLRVAVIKGGRLAETLYKDIGLRPFVDVDLLVDYSHRKKLYEILKKLGFSRKSSASEDKQFGNGRYSFWTLRPYFCKKRLVIEIHYNFPGLHLPFSLEEDLWNSLQSKKIGEVEAKVLSPEYELCLLCLHAQQHSYAYLIWLVDIAELASQDGLDWEKIFKICAEEHIQAPVFYGLYLVNCLWPETVPQKVLHRFKLAWLERRLLHFFWPAESVLQRNLSFDFPMHTPTFFSLLERKRFILAVKSFTQFTFPPQEWIAKYYGIPAHSLRICRHYLWRVSRPVILVSRRFLRLR